MKTEAYPPLAKFPARFGIVEAKVEPVLLPVTLRNLIATIMHTLFDVGTLRVTSGLPAALVRILENSKAIEGTL